MMMGLVAVSTLAMFLGFVMFLVSDDEAEGYLAGLLTGMGMGVALLVAIVP